jgi:hypothetical protein
MSDITLVSYQVYWYTHFRRTIVLISRIHTAVMLRPTQWVPNKKFTGSRIRSLWNPSSQLTTFALTERENLKKYDFFVVFGDKTPKSHSLNSKVIWHTKYHNNSVLRGTSQKLTTVVQTITPSQNRKLSLLPTVNSVTARPKTIQGLHLY